MNKIILLLTLILFLSGCYTKNVFKTLDTLEDDRIEAFKQDVINYDEVFVFDRNSILLTNNESKTVFIAINNNKETTNNYLLTISDCQSLSKQGCGGIRLFFHPEFTVLSEEIFIDQMVIKVLNAEPTHYRYTFVLKNNNTEYTKYLDVEIQ